MTPKSWFAMPVLVPFVSACQCLPQPSSDASPPTAAIMVEFRQPGGQRVTQSRTAGEPDITVVADKGDTVTAVYSGGDPEGIRKIELVYDMSYSTGTTIVRPLLTPISLTGNCPRKALLNTHNFAADIHPWRYEFSTRSENWIGSSTSSGKITVRTQ